jgi:hypothetical protein
MIERIYSNVAVFHDSDRIITTYKFEETQHSQLVKSHVAKTLSFRKQSNKESFSKAEEKKSQEIEHGLGGLPSPPVDISTVDETVVSPIALDTPDSPKEEDTDQEMTISNDEDDQVEGEELSEADILEKLAQLKAEKHRLFQQVKNMISKETTTSTATEVAAVVQDTIMPDSNPLPSKIDTQSSVFHVSGSRPSSPPTSPHHRVTSYPSPSSPSGNFKNAFKFNDRPFSRTPYDRSRPYSPNTPPLSPPTAGRRPPVVFGQPYRHSGPRQGYFSRGMPPRRY